MSSASKRIKPIALLLGVFLLGAAAGAAGMRARMFHHLRGSMDGPSGKARAAFRLDAMDRRLDLSDAQRSRLEVILNEGAEGHRAAIAECRPVLDGHRQRIDARIGEVLTPEQRGKHEEFMKRLRKRRGWKHGRPHHGGAAPAASAASSAP